MSAISMSRSETEAGNEKEKASDTTKGRYFREIRSDLETFHG
jgi:hypothetical protein